MSGFDLMQKVDPSQTYRNIQELYHIAWDPLTELIQNSMRAIQDRIDVDPTFDKGNIKIELNIQNKSFKITDDGIGFQDLDQIGANSGSRSEFGTNTSVEERFWNGINECISKSDWFSLGQTIFTDKIWALHSRMFERKSSKGGEPLPKIQCMDHLNHVVQL